ncbi:PAS domain-containing protein [Brevundimonas staleyi]|uniref:histidine kinase n=1 Tax=Brevundimonas staleyi TaxID=74326 RepID=A0ABW0FSV8_9CAUL
MSLETTDEQARQAAVRSYAGFGSQQDSALDDFVALAAGVCQVPTALVSFVGATEQTFPAKTGFDACGTPRDIAFCDHTIRGDDLMIVPDATQDARFVGNPLVTAPDGIRFYAGAPLIDPDDHHIGALCVISPIARPEGLTEFQADALRRLGRRVMQHLVQRRRIAAGVDAEAARRVVDALRLRQDAARLVSDEARDAKDADRDARDLARDVHDAQRDVHDRELAAIAVVLAESEARFRAIADSMPQMVWSTRPDGFHDYYNARWYEFTGVPDGSTDGDAWNGVFHPADQARARKAWGHSLETGDLYEIEYRLRRHDGVYRWTLGRATPIRNEAGEITRWFGTCTDIEELKRSEEGKDLLGQELSHRIKNIFAVVSSLIALSAREHPEAKAFAASARDRINALARAHEFVRPHSEVSQPLIGDTTLHTFLAALFRPYVDQTGAPRVAIQGDDATFDDQAATSVALLFHELATNAAKYGALSVAGGSVLLQTRNEGGRFILTWTETGGPSIAGKPSRQGFGSALSALSVEGQLGGRLERRWESGGLVLEADLPATALSRRRAALKQS